MNRAFVLGAGLGTRLQPLTDQLPKPLIPLFGRPLIEFAFEHLAGIGVQDLVVNTHHRAEQYQQHFPNGKYNELPITFRHEPVLLETGGGIDNVADLLKGEPFIVYNGDILTDLPLKRLVEAHTNGGHLVTLVLRSTGVARHIALDDDNSTVSDIRNMLGTGAEGSHQFTGIYACQPEFLARLEHGTKHSVIPVFLEMIKQRELGGVIIDDGEWWDLGSRDAYLDSVAEISGSAFPSYLGKTAAEWQTRIDPRAEIDPSADIDGLSTVGAGAAVEAGATLKNSIIWPGGRVEAGAALERCIVRSGQSASGSITGMDI